MEVFSMVLGVIPWLVIGLVILAVAAILYRRHVKVADASQAIVISGLSRRKKRGGEAVGSTKTETSGVAQTLQYTEPTDADDAKEYPTAADKVVVAQPEDTKENVRVVLRGRAVVNPLNQQYTMVPLYYHDVNIEVREATKEGIYVDVEAYAQIKVNSTEEDVSRAAERFKDFERDIPAFTRNQMVGALRSLVASNTIQELRSNLSGYSMMVEQEMTPLMAIQGLVLESLHIQNIKDEDGYIASLGKPEIEKKREAAEIAEANANREIQRTKNEHREIQATEEAQVDKITAEQRAEVGVAEAIAEQARELQLAQSRHEVLEQTSQNRRTELNASVVAEAEAHRKAAEEQAAADLKVAQLRSDAELYASKKEADGIKSVGEAEAYRIAEEARARQIGSQVMLAQKMLEIMPDLMKSWAQSYQAIGDVSVINTGGKDADISSMLTGEAAASIGGTMKILEDGIGIDLPEMIKAGMTGTMMAQAAKQQQPQDQRTEVQEHRTVDPTQEPIFGDDERVVQSADEDHVSYDPTADESDTV